MVILLLKYGQNGLVGKSKIDRYLVIVTVFRQTLSGGLLTPSQIVMKSGKDCK